MLYKKVLYYIICIMFHCCIFLNIFDPPLVESPNAESMEG